MILTIDIGNTNTKLAIFKEKVLIKSFRLATDLNKTSDEYFVLINEILKIHKIQIFDIKGIIISSVSPNINYTFEHMCKQLLKIKPIFLDSKLKLDIGFKNVNRSEVGSDIIASCSGAYDEYKNNKLIVLDCGTATTFNVLVDGNFIGNLINVGLKVSSDSLSHAAAKLPKVELYTPDLIIGTSTISSMRAGLVYGFVGAAVYIINKIKEEIGQAKVVATGGLSELIAQNSKIIDFIDRKLTLKGLFHIWELNQ